MTQRLVAHKIGIGEDIPIGKNIKDCSENEGPFRPKTDAAAWLVLEERESEFEILVLSQL
ncbi:hypothetical protein [Paenibacillus urinalis]|uniref:hypothetical protein n=1 Tax=Paenibacillus urinalis TaxID=521520 RepID=UPI001960967C